MAEDLCFKLISNSHEPLGYHLRSWTKLTMKTQTIAYSKNLMQQLNWTYKCNEASAELISFDDVRNYMVPGN